MWTAWNDNEEEGNFVRLDTFDAAQWTNWGVTRRGKPEPDGGRRENCVAAYGGDFKWHDYPCSAKHLPLCFLPPVSI